MRSIINSVSITDVLGIVPAHVSHFDDEVANYRQDPASSEKLKKLMGYGTHHLSRPGTTVSDMAEFGFRDLVTRGRLSPDEVGALVLVTQTPDFVLPATSSYLHGKLGLTEAAHCLDINDGCNGFIKGLHTAAMILTTTDVECVVLVTGDVLSQRTSPEDRNSFPLIGDAVALTVVRKNEGAKPICFDLRNDGLGYDRIMIPAGAARLPVSDDALARVPDVEGNTRSKMDLHMQGRDVFTFTQTIVPDFLEDFFEWTGLDAKTIDRVYFHQANAFIIDRLRKRLQLTETQAPDGVIRRYGNSSSATIPMAIAAESSPEVGRSIACGFGVGLAWGAATLDLTELAFKTIISYGEDNG